MRIVACVRLALDWNLSTKDFRIEAGTWKPVVSFPRTRIDQYDEIAVEIALQARKLAAGAVVHALTAGPAAQDMALRHALSMSADKASRVDFAEPVGPAKARAIAHAVRNIPDCAVVLAGRTGSEAGSGSTGPMLAEALGWPLLSNVTAIESLSDAGWRMLCETVDGMHLVKGAGPVVATVTNAKSNVPRPPGMKDKIRAHREPIEIIPHTEAHAPFVASLVKRHIPQVSRSCRFVKGSAREQAQAVAAAILSASGGMQ